MIRRPGRLDRIDDEWVFNAIGAFHYLDVVLTDGRVLVYPSKSSWSTEKNIIFRP